MNIFNLILIKEIKRNNKNLIYTFPEINDYWYKKDMIDIKNIFYFYKNEEWWQLFFKINAYCFIDSVICL